MIAGKPGRPGFTLIELLVVIAIISLLVSILLPSLSRAKELTRTAICLSQVRSMGIVEQMYAHERAYLPPGFRGGNAWWDIRASDFCRQLTDGHDGWYFQEWVNPDCDKDPIIDCPTAGEGWHGWHCEYGRSYGLGEEWNVTVPKLEDVTVPSEKVSMADVRSWTDKTYGASGPSWRLAGSPGVSPTYYWPNAVAFIHLDKANFSFLDSHAETLTVNQPDDDWFWPLR